MIDNLKYSILDPSGNITLLVESNIDIPHQSSLASELMKKHPEAEQVGFVRFSCDELPSLRMAEGEFCGNASLCAAFLFSLRTDNSARIPGSDILLQVSGVKNPLTIKIINHEGNSCYAGINMPGEADISKRVFEYKNLKDEAALVKMEGISHIIIEKDSALYKLVNERENAESAVRAWCSQLKAQCLGIMFLEKLQNSYQLTPLVCVPSGNTVFWEHSCASGTCAASMYLGMCNSASKAASDSLLSLNFTEPGGELRVTFHPSTKEIWLYNHICLLSQFSASY